MKNNILTCFIVMAIWGSLYPMVKLGYSVFEIYSTGDILTFAGLRFLFCGLFVILFCLLFKRNDFSALKRNLLPVLAAGFCSIILHYSFSYLGLNLTDGSKSAILKQTGTVFYICFAALFFKDDKLTARKLIAMLLGIAGIFVINLDQTGFHFYIGDLLLLLSSFCTVFSNIIYKNVFQKVEPILAAGVAQFSGGTILLLVGLCFGGNAAKLIPRSNIQILTAGYILAASIISYCLWYVVVKKQKLSKLYIIKFSEPLFAAVISAAVLKENIFQIKYLAAFLLISTGIFIANRGKAE